MVQVSTIFKFLAEEKDSAADAALLSALEDADLGTGQAIVETLLLRKTRQAYLGLVTRFHLLDEPLRQLVIDEMDGLFTVLRECTQTRDEQVRLNVLELIGRGHAYRASYLLDQALRDRSKRVRESAAATLCGLATELIDAHPVTLDKDQQAALSLDDIRQRMSDLESFTENRRQVVSAIEAGLTSFDLHLHPQVVEAALWFVDDMGPKFWPIITNTGSRACRAVTTILAGPLNRRLVPFAMSALNYSEFRPHILKALAISTDADFLTEWLRQSWRLVQPKVARGMSAIKELACIQTRGMDLLNTSTDTHRHAARWIAATAIPESLKLEAIKEFQRRADRTGQRSALWMLCSLQDARSTALLRIIADDNDQEFANIARRELARRRPMEMPLSRLLNNNEEGSWDREDWSADPVTFDRYWASFDQLSNEERIRIGQQVLTQTPLVQAVLNRRLVEADVAERIRAIRIITVLKLVKLFSDQLYRLSYDTNPEIRSVAVAALGQLDNATSKRILRNALSDEDMRVQANAVEAVDQMGDPSIADDLLPKLSSPHNRVRANAVKALLKLGVREAAEALFCMLSDDNRMQRISALWLVDSMGLSTLTKRIIALAESDDDPNVRSRAKTIAENILAQKPNTTAKACDTKQEVAST